MTQRWRGVVIALVVVALAIGGTLLGLHLTGGDASTRPILGRPSSYQIVYRVTAQTGSTTQSWEVLTVHRPFVSSDVVYGADPAVAAAVA